MDDFRTPGDGSFSLGSRTWPGLSKLVEECGEVLQIAGKIMGTGGAVQHWDGKGDLDERIALELCDLFAAARAFFQLNGFDGVEAYVERERSKYETFLRWHADGLQEPEDKVTEPDTSIPKDLRDRLIQAWNFGQFADDLNVPLAGSIRADIRQLCNVLERMPFAAPARRSSPQAPAQVEARVTMPQAITDPDPLHLSRILHELAGAASLCWEPRPTGVFDSQLAIQFVEQALAEIRSRMMPAPAEAIGETCIDGGKCHHACTDKCFRRECCVPLSGYVGPWAYNLAEVPMSEPVAYLYTLEYGETIADRRLSEHQLNYPFGVCGSDYLIQNDDGVSYVRQTPLYTKDVEAGRDAERYSFLRGDGGPTSVRWPRWEVAHWTGNWNPVSGKELDAAIDAALRGEVK